jgi:lipopolysaccharide transport system ATP-binding protein
MHDPGVAIRFTGVGKRFRRGELHDSLRDLIPALAKRLFGRAPAPPPEDRDFWALQHIDLEVRQGETLGVIGHNGAGKSTMLKHLAGIMTPTRGEIQVNGRLSALIEIGAGFHPDLTGRENVFLSGVILGMSRREVQRKFDAIVDFAGLAPFIDTPVKRYSSGMFARLGFSVAAHLEPDILVIDEVLSVGDFVFQQKSLQKMREIAHGGSTVIFVSHQLRAVSDLCRRTILLDRGCIVADGPTADVIQTYLNRERSKMRSPRDRSVEVAEVHLLQDGKETVHIRAGSTATVSVTFKARRRVERVATVIDVLDDGLGIAFNTSSERLGAVPVNLVAGEECTVTFELQMHLGAGTYHIGVYLYRYDLDREFDRALPAATFFVETDRDVRGAANLYPVLRSAVKTSSGGNDSHQLVPADTVPAPTDGEAG